MSPRTIGRRLEKLEARGRRRPARRTKPRRLRRKDCIQLLKVCPDRMIANLPRNLLEAFLAQEDMEDTRQYLQAGRRWAGLPESSLNAFWLTAWRAFFLLDIDGAADCLCESSAELRLRGMIQPLQEISAGEHAHALSMATESVKADVANQRRLLKDLDVFRGQLARPKN